MVSYQVEIKINGISNNEAGPIMLKHKEKFEQTVTFTPTRPGDNQKVEFLLYKDGQTNVYESLHLWIEVTDWPAMSKGLARHGMT